MINAIQQLGLGVQNKQEAARWLARVLGFKVSVFDDVGEAKFMTRYTGNEVCKRDAMFLLNKHGGAGLEVWQHIGREPLSMPENWGLHNLGILMGKLKCYGIDKIHTRLQEEGQRDNEPSFQLLSPVIDLATGERVCYFTVFSVIFQLVESSDFFQYSAAEEFFCAGVCGVTIGVSDIQQAMSFYRSVLGYSHVVSEQNGKFEDLAYLPHGKREFHRVLLAREERETGPFSPLFGAGQIELISTNAGVPKHIFHQRYWGDPGFIHLCFDVTGMDELKTRLAAEDVPFTIDTGTAFSMENASGRFSYLEDLDGTLIEFVETYQIPLVEKLGLKLDLRKRKSKKPLPHFMLKIAARENLPARYR